MMCLLAEQRRWPLSELAELIDEPRFEEAIANLEEIGLICREGDAVFASPVAIRGDELS